MNFSFRVDAPAAFGATLPLATDTGFVPPYQKAILAVHIAHAPASRRPEKICTTPRGPSTWCR